MIGKSIWFKNLENEEDYDGIFFILPCLSFIHKMEEDLIGPINVFSLNIVFGTYQFHAAFAFYK